MRQFVPPSPSLQSCASRFGEEGKGIGACTHPNDQTINESLNGVNRQPSKKFIFYRQPSKMQIDTVKKFRGISILLFFLFQLIVMVYWLLKNPAPNWKTSSHVLKSTPSRHYKTLELAYI